MQKSVIIDNINSVNWSIIKTQTSYCYNVPAALIGLMSENEEIILESYRKLDNHVVVQRTLHEGAFYVIPFLQAILTCSSNMIAKEYIYILLFDIGNGAAHFSEKLNYTVENNQFNFFQPSNKAGCDGVPLQISCRYAVSLGLELYMADIDVVECSLICGICDLLISYPEYTFEIRKILKGKILDQSNPEKIKLITKKKQEF
jgi:hypothetical protein